MDAEILSHEIGSEDPRSVEGDRTTQPRKGRRDISNLASCNRSHEAERLAVFGKTISDAADFYLKHLEATARSVPLSEALKELIRNRKSSGASKRYCYDIELRIQRFCDDFPLKNVAEITTQDVDDWLGRLALAPVTRNTFRRDLRTLFSFAMTRRYCVENPVAGTSKANEVGGDILILSIEQVTNLLKSAGEATLPFRALGAFAGLRPAELERIDWAEYQSSQTDFGGLFPGILRYMMKVKMGTSNSGLIIEYGMQEGWS